MSEFVLQVQDIDETGKDYSFVLTRAWLDASLSEVGLRADPETPPGALSVHAQKNGKDYLIAGQVQVGLVTDCSRCLAAARVPVQSDFATLFTRVGNASGRAPGDSTRRAPIEPVELTEEDSDDLQHEEFSGQVIVLDDLIREYLVLEVPMQPLCSAECKGIALPEHVRPPEDVFGPSDGSVDPRLAPLLRLRDKVPPNKE